MHAPMSVENIIERFEAIPGMMSRLAAASFVSALRHQERQGIDGALVEFGVYKGRSAYILDVFRRGPEAAYFVDTRMLQDVRDLFEDKTGVHLIEGSSANFFETQAQEKGLIGGCRLVHVDGSHTFDNVWGDLVASQQLLNDSGIAILDDFQNPNFPQVQAALFRYMYTEDTDLVPFLIGANKCFVCRAAAHEDWMRFVMKEFVADMQSAGHAIQLSKTDRHAQCDVVSFRGRKSDEDALYGPKLYSHFFKELQTTESES